jgi:uncharacterized HAD superfamily protein
VKIDPEAIAFDVDGVVADTMHLMLAIAETSYGVSGLRYEEISCYELRKCLDIPEDILTRMIADLIEGDYTLPLAPLEGCVSVLQRLVHYRDPLLFVTARPHPGPMAWWLPDTLKLAADRIELVSTGAFDTKIDVLQEHGITCFVEDRLDTCYLLAEAGILPILFRQPWNREPHPFVEVADWGDLEQRIAWNPNERPSRHPRFRTGTL